MHDVSFMELLSQYATYKYLRPKTVETYMGVVRVFRHYVGPDTQPSMITVDVVVRWRSRIIRSSSNPKGIAESSWNNYARHMKALYKFGIEHELVPLEDNPFDKVSVRQPKKPKKTLQPDQVRYAREVLSLTRTYEVKFQERSKLYPTWFWQAVMETFYYTGIRLNQLLHITAGDVNLKNKSFRASAEGSKTNAETTLPIPDALYPYLQELLIAAHNSGFKRGDQLFNVNRFSSRHNRAGMDTYQVERFFQALSELTGYRISPHRFRHYLGTTLMSSPGRNIHLTQQILNHTDLRSTMEYVHPDLEEMRKALNQRIG